MIRAERLYPLDSWSWLRFGYRVALILLFAAILHWWPNRVLFGRMTRPDPADYVSFVNEHCAPVLRAVAAHQRDVGKPPDYFGQLVAKYAPKIAGQWAEVDSDGVYFEPDPYHDRIRYVSHDGTGGWNIRGHLVNGLIPAPPVPEYVAPTFRSPDHR